ncbi:MAG: DUF1501 domain-containing protein, partial [Acidimicrobiales bacterium]
SGGGGGGDGSPAAAPAAAAPAPSPGAAGPDGGILVLVGLYGGNDGLNTVIPLDDGDYLSGRGDLAYPADQALPLADGLGLHPNLRRLKAVWDEGHLAVVQGVGYPTPSRSHFRSMDIWQTAVPDAAERTGWLGRWLDRTANQPMQALAVNPNLPRALVGNKATGISVPLGQFTLPGTPELAGVLRAFGDTSMRWPGEAELAERAAQASGALVQVQSALKEVRTARANRPPAGDPVNAANPLAVQLDVVSRSIRAGVPTRVYTVTVDGFDTHQREKANHANLMASVDEGVGWFLGSLAGDARAGQVVVMTFSEFGRRVKANGSAGTDHGAAAPLFVAGPAVKGGLYGEHPSLTDLDDGDLKFNTDFRSVYATVLDHVLGMDPKDVLGAPFKDLGFLQR